tara:strand:+ start:1153 stop:1755 length:603 start_codon:yes stop_codon:yes gene_type:complete
MESKLKDIIMKEVKWGLRSWSLSLDRDVYKQYKLSMISKLYRILKDLSFPVLASSGYIEDHLAENISQVLVRGLFDSEYFSTISESYECLDIPTSSIFFRCPKVSVSDPVLAEFKDSLTKVVNGDSVSENDKFINIDLSTEDKAYHQVFDQRIEVKLLENLNNLDNETLSMIIGNVNTRYRDLENREKNILRENTNLSSI